MKQRCLIMLITVIALATGVSAQRRLVVVDLESNLPIAGVNVNDGRRTHATDSAGWVSVGDSARSIVLSHVNYESRLVNLSELTDTVLLVSKYLALHEVVVLGEGKHEDPLKELRQRLLIDKREAQLLSADPSGGVNLLGMVGKLIPKKWRKGAKRAERRKHLEEVLEGY